MHLIPFIARSNRPVDLGWMPRGAVARTVLFGFLLTLLIGESTVRGQFDIPQTNLAPIGGSSFNAPGLGPPGGFSAPATAPRISFGDGSSGSLFDPYAGSSVTGYSQPNGIPATGYGTPTTSPYGGGLFSGGSNGQFSGGGGAIAQAPPIFGGGSQVFGGQIFGGSPVVVPPTSTGAATGFGNPSYPPSAIPMGGPSTLFPGGLFGGGGFFGGAGASGMTAFRLLQGPRARHTFISGGNGDRDLSINDTDVSVAFAFPSFLYSTRPLFVVPSFSLHLWDGPQASTGADLPANAYSAFLDFGWQTDPNQMAGIELGARVGAFTDFDTFNSDSIRVLGKGLLSFRLTPNTTVKGGVYYLDRNKVKLLPAGGLLWQPNPYTRMDIFFPQPKLARYWRTVGTKDVWWYLTGDYGGGSWTVQRDNGTSDSIDINDIRVMLGMEWGLTDLIRVGRRSSFAEIGYVFDREIEYKKSPGDNIDPGGGILFRAGIGY